MAIVKIFVCGSVNGNFSKFFKKINKIKKTNGPFDMVLCCGNFFSDDPSCQENWNKIILKKTTIDVPVYILGPTTQTQEKYFTTDQLMNGGEVYENILYLGRRGIFSTTSGLTLAYVSGTEKGANTKSTSSFSKEDIDHLIEQAKREDSFKGVDILLSSAWAKGIEEIIKLEDGDMENSSSLLTQLVMSLKPRYHLSSHNNKFYEPPPYRNHEVLQQNQQHVSRFIAMAPFVNEESQKGKYAFSIRPISECSREQLIIQPEVVIPSPYKLHAAKNAEKKDGDEVQQFFFRTEDRKRKHGQDGGREKKTPKGPPPLSADCWFCLGSKNVEKHLVVSVGETCYIALAKGALNEDHVLICPVGHHNSTVVLPDDVRMEMEKYKDCLRKMFAAEKKALVTFERNFYTQHLQLQVIGVKNKLGENTVAAFEECAREYSLEMMVVPEEKDLTEMVAITTPYFCAEVGEDTRFLHRVKGKMPLQFGREVLCSESVLDIPDRVDWKNCRISKEEETTQTKAFIKRFQPFDFNFS